MAKRIILALWALIFATQALAANQKPADLAGVTITKQAIAYTSGTTLNLLGNGTATAPDTPPWYALMPADIATSNRSAFWDVVGDVGSSNRVDCSNLAVTCEAKFRGFLGGNHVLYDDPIRNYGEPGTSHCHTFFGNRFTNAYSTYPTLRTRNEAHSSGGRDNGTGYWSPCFILTNPFGNGKNYSPKIAAVGLYYLADNSVSQWLVSLPTGLRYVGGTNMDDPENTARLRAIVVANAQTGTSGRYAYRGNGFKGYQCLVDANSNAGDGTEATLTGAQTVTGTQWVPYIKGNDGSDPFLGNCKTNTTTGLSAVILADFDGPDCWDGVNPWVPGGYDHVINSISDSQLNSSRVQYACPNHWYHIPSITLKVQNSTTGFADYSRWRLSSDDGMQAKLNSLPTCTTDATGAYANAPCATHSGPYWNGSAYVIPNGTSFHTDWMMGWDGLSLKTWEAYCLGVRNLYDGNGNINTTTGTLIPNSPHTCGSSTINGTTFLKVNAPPPSDTAWPSAHNPIVSQVTADIPTSSAANMFQIRTVNPSGMASFHVH